MKIYASLLAAGFLLTTSAASADPVKVKAGGAGVVAAHATLKENSCEAGAVPQLKITTPPSHGTARVAILDGKSNNPQCQGKSFKFGTIIYTPAAGYRGPDSVSYGYEYELYVTDTRKAWISKTAAISVE